MTILFATGNTHKVAQIAAVLNRPIQQIEIELLEIQAVDVRAVIEEKARTAYRSVGQPVLVEDTSLSFRAWNGLPGALIKWFLTTAGNEGICRMLSAFEDRSAIAEVCLGYFDGSDFRLFAGQVEGVIVTKPRGSDGFGWDAIFQPDGYARTFAEMTPEEAGVVNMRLQAARQFRDHLDSHNVI
jgi:XTP/dITP diphosphohydrolase